MQWVLEEFRNHWTRMHKVGLRLIRCIALGLGKNKYYFDPWFKDECSSVFRSQYYLPRLNSDNKLICPEHRDSGFLTILNTFSFPGLQVEYKGKYHDVKSIENSFVVNIGAALMRISNFKIKATFHRVIDHGIERYSCPFFFDPKYSARIIPTILESSRTSCEDTAYDLDPTHKEDHGQQITWGEFCATRMKQFAENKGFKCKKINFDFQSKFGIQFT